MIKTVLFVLAAVGVCLLIRSYAPGYAAAASAFACVAVMMSVLPQLLSLLNGAQAFFDGARQGGEYYPALIRVVGIALLSQFAADTCRDCGETALASQTEFAGKALMIVCAMPVLQDLLSLVKTF